MTTLNLSWTSSIIQERMLRCRLETRHINNPTDDEIYRTAVKSIQYDQINKSIVNEVTTNDISSLFEEQLKRGSTYLYLMSYNDQNILSVIAYSSLDAIKTEYISGQLGAGIIPKMTRKKQNNGTRKIKTHN